MRSRRSDELEIGRHTAGRACVKQAACKIKLDEQTKKSDKINLFEARVVHRTDSRTLKRKLVIDQECRPNANFHIESCRVEYSSVKRQVFVSDSPRNKSIDGQLRFSNCQLTQR